MNVLRTLCIGLLLMGSTLALAADGFAQAPTRAPDVGKTDPTQLQRSRELIDLNPIQQPKPEIDILTGTDSVSPPADGKIVIIPDEPDKTTPPAAKDREEPKKN